MKRRTVCLLLATAMLLPLFGCASNPAPTEETALTEEELSAAAVDFALALLKNAHTEGETAVVSPLSVLTALALTANGAAGETRAQLERMLGASVGQWNAWLSDAEESESLLSADSVWIRDTDAFAVREAFLRTAQEQYRAEVCRAAFDESTCAEINAWVSEHTDGRIERMLESISADAAMYIINALSFEADWAYAFEENKVTSGKFYAADGTTQTVELMNGDVTRYLCGENAVGFCKDYADDRFTFLALLPDESLTAEEYLATLTGEKLLSLLANETGKSVCVTMPKLSFETGFTLNDALRSMGMTDAFDANRADFSELADCTDGALYVGKVAHQTSLTVDTQGTRAGAATSVEMLFRMLIKQESISLTRPFLMAIWDNRCQMPVFLGIINSVN